MGCLWKKVKKKGKRVEKVNTLVFPSSIDLNTLYDGETDFFMLSDYISSCLVVLFLINSNRGVFL